MQRKTYVWSKQKEEIQKQILQIPTLALKTHIFWEIKYLAKTNE